MSDWNYSEVGGQQRWTITLPDGVVLRIYLNPGEAGDALQGGPYHWQVVVGDSVADSGSAEHVRFAKKTACDALIAYAQKLLEAVRRIPMTRYGIRIHALRRTPGHITLAVFCHGKCGELTIGVEDEALFREAFPVTWVESVSTRDESFFAPKEPEDP